VDTPTRAGSRRFRNNRGRAPRIGTASGQLCHIWTDLLRGGPRLNTQVISDHKSAYFQLLAPIPLLRNALSFTDRTGQRLARIPDACRRIVIHRAVQLGVELSRRLT
jgi:hypothetical protein